MVKMDDLGKIMEMVLRNGERDSDRASLLKKIIYDDSITHETRKFISNYYVDILNRDEFSHKEAAAVAERFSLDEKARESYEKLALHLEKYAPHAGDFAKHFYKKHVQLDVKDHEEVRQIVNAWNKAKKPEKARDLIDRIGSSLYYTKPHHFEGSISGGFFEAYDRSKASQSTQSVPFSETALAWLLAEEVDPFLDMGDDYEIGFWGITSVLDLSEGNSKSYFIQDFPTIKDGRIYMNRTTLERKLKEGDPSIRFAKNDTELIRMLFPDNAIYQRLINKGLSSHDTTYGGGAIFVPFLTMGGEYTETSPARTYLTDQGTDKYCPPVGELTIWPVIDFDLDISSIYENEKGIVSKSPIFSGSREHNLSNRNLVQGKR